MPVLADVADMSASLGTCTHFDFTQQESVVVIIHVKSDGVAEHVFRIRKTDGLRGTSGSLRCHSGEWT